MDRVRDDDLARVEPGEFRREPVAVGLDDGSPGDFQMRLPTLSITPGTSIVVSSWWFLLPPL